MFSAQMVHSQLKLKTTLIRLLCAAAINFLSFCVVFLQNYPLDGQILSDLHSIIQQCVANRDPGLTAHIIDHCHLILKFPEGTNSSWYNAQFKIFEPFSVQYRNMTTMLTKEYLDARPDGWLDYAPKRIAQLGIDKCYNRTLCEENINVVLPAKPPFHPRQFRTRANFGKEIDSHDTVKRDNEAHVNEANKYIY
ncbi:hypothetical protein ACJIZ3_023789 [Penstemon smallii]|uniref:Transposase n=1 Tax=Penstemon smallii TaxID=265156 RepID=A0ABD3TS12_9LAMI